MTSFAVPGAHHPVSKENDKNMTEIMHRFKTGLTVNRLHITALIITIPLVMMMGWIFAQPLYPVQFPYQATPRVLQPSGEAVPGWLTNGNDAGIADKIRNAKRTSLYEPTAFKRIARGFTRSSARFIPVYRWRMWSVFRI